MSTQYELDVHLHTKMLEEVSKSISERVADRYEYTNSFKAVDAIARLITAKAEKQIVELGAQTE